TLVTGRRARIGQAEQPEHEKPSRGRHRGGPREPGRGEEGGDQGDARARAGTNSTACHGPKLPAGRQDRNSAAAAPCLAPSPAAKNPATPMPASTSGPSLRAQRGAQKASTTIAATAAATAQVVPPCATATPP